MATETRSKNCDMLEALVQDEDKEMTSWKTNKIDTVSPLRNGIAAGLSPRKKPHRSKSSGSLGSLATAWEKGRQNWVHDHFSKRECIKFIADPKKPSHEVCCCGRFLSDHDDAITEHHTATWTPDSCTKKAPTNAFGDIQFVGSANQSARAPFVRLAEDTSIDLVMKLILKVWKLEVPNLVISVTGGAKSFHLKPRLKEVFQRGLIKAAKSTGAWIITGGTNTGVMKHVGEAVRQMKVLGGASSNINVIGIATWGIVDRSTDLTSESGMGKHPARYRITHEEASKAPLDSAHTHFLLVDNGTVGQYGVEIDLRSKVEEAISKLHTESRSSTGSIEVPVVMLVLEGGPGTVKTMTEAIKKKIPAVVIDGSGRAADVVAFAYKHTILSSKNGKNAHVIDPNYKETVQAKVVEVFGERSLENVYKMIEDVVEDEKMVTVYRLDEAGNASRDIDLAILKALLKASRSSPLAQLNLALAWNRVDVAESDIFTENTIFKSGELHNPMLTALLDDKADFVRLFLENGLSMREFLNIERLILLYRSVCNGGVLGALVRHELKKRGTKYVTPQLIGYAIEELMGDSYHSYYLDKGQYFAGAQRHSSQFILRKRGQTHNTLETSAAMDRIDPLPFPFLDIFTWAILSSKKELAILLWEKGPHPIATALFATKLLKEMANYSQKDHQIVDTTEGLLEMADEFENLALNVLDECYRHDEDSAQSLLVRPLESFGFLTCMDIAQLATDQDFIAHSSCQVLFNKLWMGGIVLDTPWWKILLCFMFPFLIYPLIYFVVDEYEDGSEVSEYDENVNILINMNKNGNVAGATTTGKEPIPNNFKAVTDSMEMTTQNETVEAASNANNVKDKKTGSRRNLLSEGDDAAVDVALRASSANYFERIFRFYEAPFTKFVTSVCSYLAFLLMFCYVILMDLQKHTISTIEYVLMGWVVVLTLEEIRQITTQQPKHIFEKFNLYMADTWNFVDILSLVAFAVAFILRYFPDSFDGDLFEAARIIYILDIIIFIVRSLQMFSVNRQLGPKLVMIKTMLEDLKQFIIILAVFIVSYGVALQAALYPNTRNFWDVLRGIIEKPYFQMYGELFYEDYTEDGASIHKHGKWMGPIFLGLYLLLTNVLLLNLLIAIFNYTFEKIQEGSDRVWKFQRYDLIREYHDRPTLVPPLMILSHIFMFIKWIIQICGCGNKPVYGSALKLNLSQHENDQLSSWENHNKEMELIRSGAEREEEIDLKVKNIDTKVDELSNQIERMMELSFEGGTKSEKPSIGLKSAHHRRSVDFESSISSRVNGLEERLLHTTETLEKILEIVSSSSYSTGGVRIPEKKSIHIKARKSPYPLSTIMRVSLPDEVVAWKASLPNYNPPVYTADAVLENPPWADPDIIVTHPRPSMKFNQVDSDHNVDRRSYIGTYKIVDGLPQNPMGRTGLTGRGLLGRFGPNHAADPIVTRWKMTSSGALIENGKKVLEFVAIQRKDNQEWAIPGGMVEPGEQVSRTLKKEFIEEALAGLDMLPAEREQLKMQIDGILQEGKEVFKGYVDDPRNTDVAWVETLAVNFHDDTGEIFNKIKLQAGDDAAAVRWQRVSGNIPLYANHVAMLENVAHLHNANF